MAALQGYFLRHKDDAQRAIEQFLIEDKDARTHTLATPSFAHPQHSNHHQNHNKVVRSRPVKALTAEQVDKMVFNPQPGWDKDL